MPPKSEHDLRSFVLSVQEKSPRDFLEVVEPLDASWEMAACTIGFEKKLRVPLLQYSSIKDSTYPIVQNVCSSLQRIARSLDITVDELEHRIDTAYDNLIPSEEANTGPVRDIQFKGNDVNLFDLPKIRYSAGETHGYLSAACVVAIDESTGAQNLSFHRLMINSENQLVIYMTPGGHLDTIFQENRRRGVDTPVAAFIGSHPLWSLGSLAAGKLSLDEYSVIGGLLQEPLCVIPAHHHPKLLIPSHAEFSLEGVLKHDETASEGPYGEAFGYSSSKENRPVFEVQLVSHRKDALFQDIVPGHQEHMIMTSVAIRVHLNRTLKKQYEWVHEVFLPAPMTAYIGVSDDVDSDGIREMLEQVLQNERFVKIVCVFDANITLSNAKETQKAIACHVQAHNDLVMLEGVSGNGLDPSELDGKTTKWGLNATATTIRNGSVNTNQIPEEVSARLDVNSILKRALAGEGKAT